jgi:small subunit ribosomal protein S9
MSNENTISAIGRRKTATARVRLMPGTGKITINGRPYDDYFPVSSFQSLVLKPLEVAKSRNVYDVVANANGGGVGGQAGAVSLGIARALLIATPEVRGPMKAEGLLTRDPRMKERKKPGQPGARKRFQFSKR